MPLWDQIYLKISIAGAESEIRDSHEGRQERLDDDKEFDNTVGDDEEVENEDDCDLDVVLEGVGDQGLAEEGGDAGQHSRSWEKHHCKYHNKI